MIFFKRPCRLLVFSASVLFFAVSSVFSEEQASISEKTDWLNIVVDIPEPKRPRPAEGDKILEAERKDSDGSDRKAYAETLSYGTPSEINSTVDRILENDDPRFLDELYELFYRTGSSDIKVKLLDYFAKREDPCLEDYAVEILDDPYDTPNAIVEKCFSYVSAVKSGAAAPALVKLLEQGEEKYFNGSLSALGKTGGAAEAVYLAEYLERDDLSTAQRQALMRTLGQMNAVETFDLLVQVAQDEEENGFVRMYAAESIGNMKKDEAVPVLCALFEKSDPNMRQYCIKGLKNFPENSRAVNMILQGIRDDHYKVRLESIKASTELKIADSVDFIIYRSKNDVENAVKKECWTALSKIGGSAAEEHLLRQINEKKVSDGTKKAVCEALMAEGSTGEDEILRLAKEALKDDRRKDLRYALGKLFIKYARPSFAEISVLYLQSKDTTTVSQGLELYRNGRYEMARASVKAVAEDSKSKSANRNKAKKLLGIDDEEESDVKNSSDGDFSEDGAPSGFKDGMDAGLDEK